MTRNAAVTAERSATVDYLTAEALRYDELAGGVMHADNAMAWRRAAKCLRAAAEAIAAGGHVAANPGTPEASRG